jgi:hypothetical protein
VTNIMDSYLSCLFLIQVGAKSVAGRAEGAPCSLLPNIGIDASLEMDSREIPLLWRQNEGEYKSSLF